jgi:alpha-ketoglutarate-dependent taurine dioxygenase
MPPTPSRSPAHVTTSTLYGPHVTIECRRLTGRFGAEVSQVRLAGVDDRGAKDLRDALHEHLVLVFRDQVLGDDEQLAVARRLGAPYVHPIAREFGATEARVEHIVDDVDHHPYQDQWHTDVSFVDEPPRYGSLRAVDLPESGGDTLWLDARAAYDSLPDHVRASIEEVRALHAPGIAKAFAAKAGGDVARAISEKFPGVEHPVVVEHRESGRRCLYVNEGFTKRIVGLPDDEERALRHRLFHHLRNPNHQLRHTWRPGDVVLWDEQATQHFAVADFLPARREMARITIAGGARPEKETP